MFDSKAVPDPGDDPGEAFAEAHRGQPEWFPCGKHHKATTAKEAGNPRLAGRLQTPWPPYPSRSDVIDTAARLEAVGGIPAPLRPRRLKPVFSDQDLKAASSTTDLLDAVADCNLALVVNERSGLLALRTSGEAALGLILDLVTEGQPWRFVDPFGTQVVLFQRPRGLRIARDIEVSPGALVVADGALTPIPPTLTEAGQWSWLDPPGGQPPASLPSCFLASIRKALPAVRDDDIFAALELRHAADTISAGVKELRSAALQLVGHPPSWEDFEEDDDAEDYWATNKWAPKDPRRWDVARETILPLVRKVVAGLCEVRRPECELDDGDTDPDLSLLFLVISEVRFRQLFGDRDGGGLETARFSINEDLQRAIRDGYLEGENNQDDKGRWRFAEWKAVPESAKAEIPTNWLRPADA